MFSSSPRLFHFHFLHSLSDSIFPLTSPSLIHKTKITIPPISHPNPRPNPSDTFLPNPTQSTTPTQPTNQRI
ncbi:hypothetical protein EX30DRAFT_261362 [Ascodesmis nigricans]|uniref:Uncharacterized protein n=1 Tax=Ascodesmis nigricans TaxID=341454 RepID=A0A4V3SIT4_9PEZI|nr:hypothetical protein EX30DRAFT_261362 [Ascodesmis nigricans]